MERPLQSDPNLRSSFNSYQALTGPFALVLSVSLLSSKLPLPDSVQASAWVSLYVEDIHNTSPR